MLDINFIRANRQKVEDAIRNKAYEIDLDEILRLDDERKELDAIVDKVNASLADRLVELGVDPHGPKHHGPKPGPMPGPDFGPKPGPFHGPAGDCAAPHAMKRGPWCEPDGGRDNTLRA